jgi:hypothetical protein
LLPAKNRAGNNSSELQKICAESNALLMDECLPCRIPRAVRGDPPEANIHPSIHSLPGGSQTREYVGKQKKKSQKEHIAAEGNVKRK